MSWGDACQCFFDDRVDQSACTLPNESFRARGLVLRYYEHDRLLYPARTRNGFTPAVGGQLFKKLRPLEIKECPFVNLSEAKSGRWGRA